MGAQCLLMFLLLMGIRGIRSCLECDPNYFTEVISLLEDMVPPNIPLRAAFLERQIQDLRDVNTRVHQGKKRLRVLDVRQAIGIREWFKDKLMSLKHKPWKGTFIFQGQLLKLRQDLEFHLTEILKTFSDLACSEDCNDDPAIAEQREIALFLVLMVETVTLGSIAILYYFCIIHRKKMKAKIEELRQNSYSSME